MKNKESKDRAILNQLDDNITSSMDDNERLIEEHSMISKFKALVHEYPQQHWNLQFYLKKLNISRVELYQLTQLANEAPPMTIVKEIVASEIAKKLVSTEIPIKELTTCYGFSTSASLTRFVKKHTGLPPSKFRALNALDYI